MLTRDEILALDLPRKEIEVPGWGKVWVRTLSANEMLKLADHSTPGLITAICVCDEQGARIFEDSDADALNGKSIKAISAVIEAYNELNSLNEKSVADAKKN